MGRPDESPVLAQRAASEGPRWTRAIGDHSGHPDGTTMSKLGRTICGCLRPCLRKDASWRAGAGRVRTGACLNTLRVTYVNRGDLPALTSRLSGLLDE